jgi:hypothetical protein
MQRSKRTEITADEIIAMLRQHGVDIRWADWDAEVVCINAIQN